MTNMFKREVLAQVAIPAVVLFIANFAVAVICGTYTDVFSQIIAGLIAEFFALITCYYLVIRKNKASSHIWANYIIWILIFNLGILAETFGF